jgi:D-3-phosphoglycerate dehydrogenase/(S)-sulfolactate dehydrogenase
MPADRRKVALIAGGLVEDQLDLSVLERAALAVTRQRDLQNTRDEAVLIERLAGTWGVVAGGETYSRPVLAALPELRVIARVGVGYDRVDVQAATEFGKVLSITPNTIEPAVAEWTLAQMLAVRRRLLQADRAVRNGRWTTADVLSPSLSGATVGLIGLGRVGREVAKRLVGFDCTVIGADPAANSAEWHKRGVETVPLDALIERSDVISLHVPLMPSTRHIIGAKELARMRPSAIVINTSRGGLIDEEALFAALQSGRLAGAGLDTFETEPLSTDSPLLSLDNVVVSGHVAYATLKAARASAQGAIDALAAFANGEVPACVVNPEVLTGNGFARATARPA